MKELRQSQCLEFFHEMMKLVTTNRHYERVFHFIVDRLVRLYHCRACAIVLVDRESEYLRIENQYGLSHEYCKAFRSHLATGAVGRLMWTGEPLVIVDARQTPGLHEEVAMEGSFASCLIAPISVHHQTLGYLYADSGEVGTFTEEELPLLHSFARLAGLALYMSRLYDENLRLDRHDSETGLQRYSAFSEVLAQHLHRAEESGERLGLLMLDIDNYKRITNTYGGEVRRAFLREFGGLLRRQARSFDELCRYGPDEILVLMPAADVEIAVEMSKRLCTAIRAHTFTEHDVLTTVSGGIAVYPDDGISADELLLAVKHRVFEAQRHGRDQLHHGTGHLRFSE